jgi:hypothetical protein
MGFGKPSQASVGGMRLRGRNACALERQVHT